MKTWVVIIIFLSCAALVGAVIVDWYKDNIIDDLKTQAVKLGYAHVVAIDNKLEWEWIETIWIDPNTEPIYYRDDEGNYINISKESLYFTDDEGNDIKVTE